MFQNKLRELAVILVAGSAGVQGQTQVDLRTQSKTVDFTAAPATRPVKTGSVIPATCTLGDLFYLTTAIAGANLYGCVAVNTWALQSGGGGGGGGSVTVDSSSTVVGARGVLNFIAGTGIMNLISDTGTQINIQQNMDPSYVLSRTQEQAGSDLSLSCTSGSATVYGCTPTGNVLSVYTDQQRLAWKPDVSCGGAPTINVSTLGAKQLYRSDGTAIQSGDCAAGAQVSIWYDATANAGAGGFKLTNPVNVNVGQITGVLGSANGGTGVNNGASTLTLAGNHTTAGAFASTFTFTGATNVTFPTSGTLSTTATNVALAQTPLTTLGDTLYVNATPGLARLAGNTTATLNVLTQTGTGTVSAAPVWQTTAAAGIAPFTFKPVTFSATPAFTFGSGATTFEITLTGNVTSSSVAGAAAGQDATYIICQDATGSRTFVWPASFKGAMTIGTTASKCNVQKFAYDGTTFYATAAGLINQ